MDARTHAAQAVHRRAGRTSRAALLLAAAMATGVAGCAARSASVGHRMLPPATGPRHAVEATQFFVMPMTLTSPEPAFPQVAEMPGAFELTVCAEVWLSADGDITRVAPFDGARECAGGADPRAQAYARSVAEALQRWEFTPAMVCEFPPHLLDKRDRGDCTGPEVVVRRVPVRLDYAFTFSSRDGRRRVGFARRPATDAGRAP